MSKHGSAERISPESLRFGLAMLQHSCKLRRANWHQYAIDRWQPVELVQQFQSQRLYGCRSHTCAASSRMRASWHARSIDWRQLVWWTQLTPVRSHGESVRIKWVCLEVVYLKAVLEPSLLLLSFIKLSFLGNISHLYLYPIFIHSQMKSKGALSEGSFSWELRWHQTDLSPSPKPSFGRYGLGLLWYSQDSSGIKMS